MGRWRRLAAVAVLVLGAGTTTGCGTAGSASGEIAGFAAGSAAGALTANPFIGVATGLAVRFATSEAEAYLDRRRQATIHAAIAAAAGAADESKIVPWSAEFEIPPRRTHGQVQTIRTLGGQIDCREVLYSVTSTGESSYFVGVICRHEDGAWRWAVSEPTASAGNRGELAPHSRGRQDLGLAGAQALFAPGQAAVLPDQGVVASKCGQEQEGEAAWPFLT